MLLPIHAAVAVIMLVYVTLKKCTIVKRWDRNHFCMCTSKHMTRETLQNHCMCTSIGLVSEGHFTSIGLVSGGHITSIGLVSGGHITSIGLVSGGHILHVYIYRASIRGHILRETLKNMPIPLF